MATQDVPSFLTKKMAALALLIVGGLFAVYGMNYGATAATVLGFVLIAAGVIILVMKIMRRNQGPF